MGPKLKEWIGFNFDRNKSFEKPPREGTDESDEMKEFFRTLKSDLKKALSEKGIQIHQMKPSYYNVSAVVTDGNGKFAYLSFGDMRWSNLFPEQILVRTMKHEKDWTGGGNHHVKYDYIPEKILWLWRVQKS
jgi:hypothetical protein